MKRLFALLISLVIIASLVGCGKETLTADLSISQMKAICELATMECYYHNVAKMHQENVEGMLWWTKDKHFWVEYSGVVTLGIDISQVKIDINNTVVTIAMPEAKVLDYDIDELKRENWIIAESSASITAEDETKAFELAQNQMKENAENNTALLANAQLHAQTLLEQYIKNIGKLSGIEYTIKWEYLSNNPDQTTAQSNESNE